MDAVPAREAEDPAEKRKPRRLRLPASLVVTLVGIALSAWLLPAITRQWDDRQKEHELKAAVVGDMASATARALVGGEAVWSKRPLTQQQRARLGDEWALSELELEARLRSYFPSDVVAGWQVYAWMVDRFVDAHRVSAAAALQDVVRRDVRLNPGVADAAARLLVYGKYALPPAPRFKGDSLVESEEVR